MPDWTLTTDILVHAKGLTHAVDGAYVNDATVTATMADQAGVAVTGVGTITFSYVSTSNGEYVGTIPDTASMTAGVFYTLTITSTATISGTSFKRTDKIRRKAADRLFA